MRRCLAVCLTLVLVVPAFAAAQVSTTGTVRIVIADIDGGRLPGVTVTVSAADTVTSRAVATDAEGVATLEALAPSSRYTVSAYLTGFRDITRQNVRVSSGQITTLNETMAIGALSEAVTVFGEASPVVDVRRAVTGQDITLELTESLPTGRSYQSYLQLVPGVLPDSPTHGGNPSSRSGVNWADAVTSGNIGVSTDNQIYFEGINVTDPVTGTFGANLNTEIIQEQKVITGAIPAEYVGSAGLISTVITKSGSNVFTGSANYFFQNDRLIAADEHAESARFESNDTAFTIGGPAVRDRVWGFGSFRYTGRTEDVNAQDTHAFMRRVKTTQKQGFAKGSWSISPHDLVSVMFLNDPFERSGSIDPSVVNHRDRRRVQGGNNYSATYSRVWNNLLVDGTINLHQAEASDRASLTAARNTVVFRSGDARTLADEQLGGYGQDLIETRPTKQARAAVQYGAGRHRLKGGLEFGQHEDHLNLVYTGDPPAQYTSISNRYAAVTAEDLATGGWSNRTFRASVANDFQGFINRIDTLPNRAAFYAAYDANGDGRLTPEELGQRLVFNSTAGNPDGQINYYRTWMSAEGPQDLKVRSYAFYLQDELSFDRLTLNAGVRAENQAHYATTGAKLHAFDFAWAPRLSAAYDVTGDGTQKLSAYYGRYYDPLRMDMTSFAGSLTGATREEQIFANDEWVTYRVRGFGDGLFTPSTKIPHTDELQFQHEIDFGRNMSVSSTYWMRWTRDIFEDYDLRLYADPATYRGPIAHPDSLFLGYDYFGLDAGNVPVANFYFGTLPDAGRNYKGLEFVFRKRFSNNWQTLTSYNWLDARGNSISDGNADFAGDVLSMDPRAPNMYGPLPGTIHHIVKTAGSYHLPFGLELGATYRWNSGTVVNKTFLIQGRRLPVESDAPSDFAGITDRWVAPGAVGGVQNPSYSTFDARLQYIRRFDPVTAEIFIDVFNLLNNQAATRTEDLVSGTGTTKFGDEIQWVGPRRAFLGARIRF